MARYLNFRNKPETFIYIKNKFLKKIPIAVDIAHFKLSLCFLNAMNNPEIISSFFLINFENQIKLQMPIATMPISFILRKIYNKK